MPRGSDHPTVTRMTGTLGPRQQEGLDAAVHLYGGGRGREMLSFVNSSDSEVIAGRHRQWSVEGDAAT